MEMMNLTGRRQPRRQIEEWGRACARRPAGGGGSGRQEAGRARLLVRFVMIFHYRTREPQATLSIARLIHFAWPGPDLERAHPRDRRPPRQPAHRGRRSFGRPRFLCARAAPTGRPASTSSLLRRPSDTNSGRLMRKVSCLKSITRPNRKRAHHARKFGVAAFRCHSAKLTASRQMGADDDDDDDGEDQRGGGAENKTARTAALADNRQRPRADTTAVGEFTQSLRRLVQSSSPPARLNTTPEPSFILTGQSCRRRPATFVANDDINRSSPLAGRRRWSHSNQRAD
jgi:hypothetical protein